MGIVRIEEGGCIGVFGFVRRWVGVLERVRSFWLGAMLSEVKSFMVLGTIFGAF